MNDPNWRKNDELFVIPDAVYEAVFATQGRFFERISNIDPIKLTNDRGGPPLPCSLITTNLYPPRWRKRY